MLTSIVYLLELLELDTTDLAPGEAAEENLRYLDSLPLESPAGWARLARKTFGCLRASSSESKGVRSNVPCPSIASRL